MVLHAAPAHARAVALRLAHAAVWPLRVLRTLRASDGARSEHAVPWEDPSWWQQWSATASFSPAAQAKFLGRSAQSVRPALEVATQQSPHLLHDLFARGALAPEPTVCPCGAVYAFLTPRCPSCLGDDPLSSVLPGGLEHLQREFEAYFGAALTADELSTPAADLSRALRAHADLLGRATAAGPRDDEAHAARQLLQDLERRVAIAGLSHAALNALASATQQSPLDLLRVATSVTLAVRQLWLPHAKTGWCATAEATSTLQTQLASTWQPAFDALKALSEARLCASAALVPVRRSLRSVARASTLQRLMRKPLGVLAPGRSSRGLLVHADDDTRWLFRERRANLALERFNCALNQLQAAASNAARALDASAAEERSFGRRRARALAAFLCMMLAHDYGRASPAAQYAIASRVGKLHRKQPSAHRRGKRSRWQAARALIPALLTRGALSVATFVLLLYWLNNS